MRRTSIAFTVVLMMAFSALASEGLPTDGPALRWRTRIKLRLLEVELPGPYQRRRLTEVSFKFTTDFVNLKGETTHTETMETGRQRGDRPTFR